MKRQIRQEMSSYFAMSKAADIGKPTQSCDHRLTHERCIYIHGTPVEEKLDSPARYGCIRMGSYNIIDLFDLVGIGARVDTLDEPLSPPAPTPDGAGG
jgi:lipoprotein-anchoring transpeptidase ErfK/SrfK